MKRKTDDTIVIDTSIHASAEKIWQAWTDPSVILRWFGSDPRGKGLKASLDVRTGGHYEVTFQDSDLTQHTCFGVYLELIEFRKLKFSWSWKSEPGVESLVTITLIAEGDHTLMKFEHAHVGATSAHYYLAGWESTFAKLGRVLNENFGGNRQASW